MLLGRTRCRISFGKAQESSYRSGVGTPTLIFVHGFACSHAVWECQSEALDKGRLVLECDLRGHGQSTVGAGSTIESLGADLAGLIHSLGPGSNAVLIGHSMGCRVVLQSYLETRDSVVGVILVDSSWTSPSDFPRARQTVEDRLRGEGYGVFVGREFEQMFSRHSSETLRHRIIAEALALPESVGKPLFLQTMEWDARRMESVLGQVTVPLLLLQSTTVTADRTRLMITPGMLPTPWLDFVRRVVPMAEIRLITDVGHFSMLEASDRVNEAVASFVAPLTIHPPQGSKNRAVS